MIVSILSFVALIYSVILHEIAHGFVADRLGDPTARLAKRLTLDPRPHIDPITTILLPLLLFMTNAGVIFGAAKPVPIDPFNFREPKKDTALVALSGPVTNLLIATVAAIGLRLIELVILSPELLLIARQLCLNIVVLNVSLAIFNLFPFPPLDGFKVLLGILPDQMAKSLAGLERFGLIWIFLLLFLAPSLLFGIISPIIRSLVQILINFP